MTIGENVAAIRERIAQAAAAAGRRPEEITLCAATKMNDAQAVRQAIAAGVDCCGENRVQEMLEKYAQNAYAGAPLHFIGHLQTNKVRQVVGKVALIQSVGSLHLLEAIDREADRQGLVQPVLLEINVGEEASKSGFLPGEVFPALEEIPKFSHIQVRGLMAIPPICQNVADSRKFFQKIYQLSVDIRRKKYDNVCVDVLSMGMSADYAEAIACGSTMIRIGTGIFGPREYGRSHQS